MGTPREDVTFPASDMPAVPHRSYTGSKIKTRIIKAMSEQADAEEAASKALDRLIDVVRRFEKTEAPEFIRSLLRKSTEIGRYHIASEPDTEET